ncbi:MAG: PEP-CTERM sorting domain-containing protein [Phycisphaerales bacterium]|nr:PEP-CTERM sorting domain-containing protein [Phycisphaerales bacterium]
MKVATKIVGCAVVAALSGQALAAPLYATGFEPPVYTLGDSVNGVDGWANASGSGAGVTVSDVQALGTQSLQFDNSGSFNSFYSVRRELPTYNGVVEASVQLYIEGNVQANRLYGMYFTGSATGTLGGASLGLSIGGDGSIRAGTSWAATYQNTGLIGTADAGSFTDRWLTITLSYNNGDASVMISGLDGPNSSFSSNYTMSDGPLGLNLGTDWFTSTDRAGVGYFDNLEIVPAPGALALLGLGGLAAARRRRG